MELSRLFYLSLLITSLMPDAAFPPKVASIGINYGQIANNLLPPDKVVTLIQSIGATKVKLYDADPKVLHAFANTSVEFTVGLGNQYLSAVGDDSKKAQDWVKSNVQQYLPDTNITSIVVGNEVLTFNDTSMSSNLLPAMKSVHNALIKLGLEKKVCVTTAHSLAVLQTSYPPSSGAFRSDLVKYISPILKFHSQTGCPFLINAYPFFAYKANPEEVPLDFVLFQLNKGYADPCTNLHYDNMLFAQIDAVHSALAALEYKDLLVQISETGWPSKGDEDEVGATLENAKKYNGNLIKLINQREGTPLKRNSSLDIFVFALFNENLKPGPTSERNYGLFKPDGTAAYDLGISTTSISTDGNRTRGSVQALPTANSTTGYLSISSAMERYRPTAHMLLFLLGWISLNFY